nr:MAG TPA: hypothetical protein [Caudoviricetes sp.]
MSVYNNNKQFEFSLCNFDYFMFIFLDTIIITHKYEKYNCFFKKIIRRFEFWNNG